MVLCIQWWRSASNMLYMRIQTPKSKTQSSYAFHPLQAALCLCCCCLDRVPYLTCLLIGSCHKMKSSNNAMQGSPWSWQPATNITPNTSWTSFFQFIIPIHHHPVHKVHKLRFNTVAWSSFAAQAEIHSRTNDWHVILCIRVEEYNDVVNKGSTFGDVQYGVDLHAPRNTPCQSTW